MEREPRQPKFVLKVGDEQYICTPDNTLAFLYEKPEYDHIFYITHEDEDSMRGYHVFRHLLGDNFDVLVKRMIDGGYGVSNEEEISDSDLYAYKKSLPDYYELPDPEENWGGTKRERVSKWGRFVAYLAEEIANGKDESSV